MARKKKTLGEAVSKEIQSNFNLDAFKTKKGLKSNIKFKDQDWIPISSAFQEVTSIPGIPMGHIVLIRGHGVVGINVTELGLENESEEKVKPATRPRPHVQDSPTGNCIGSI